MVSVLPDSDGIAHPSRIRRLDVWGGEVNSEMALDCVTCAILLRLSQHLLEQTRAFHPAHRTACHPAGNAGMASFYGPKNSGLALVEVAALGHSGGWGHQFHCLVVVDAGCLQNSAGDRNGHPLPTGGFGEFRGGGSGFCVHAAPFLQRSVVALLCPFDGGQSRKRKEGHVPKYRSAISQLPPLLWG